MDPEQTFLRVHAKLSGMLLRVLKPRIRTALEYIHLVVALALFCLLVVMHTNFVQQPGCSSEFSGLEMADADLVHIKITSTGLWSLNTADGNIMDTSEQESSTDSLKIPDMDGDGLTFLAAKFWSNWIGSGAKRGKLIFKSWKNEKEFLEPEAESAADRGGSKPVVNGAEISVDAEAPHIGFPLSAKESFRSAVVHFCSKCRILFSSFWRNVKQFFGSFCQLWNTAGWAMLLDMPRSLKTFRLERLDSLLEALLYLIAGNSSSKSDLYVTDPCHLVSFECCN